eukprot:comp19358_c0_seq1/m.22302 comp19358_c0_seq1/g.22302  ORF comp19358_c0_seq1/g.22302 comp19358_c0_seq1/m.22302 type:complete len:296 (-) comp19358_c0_seq1:608-1495(-)
MADKNNMLSAAKPFLYGGASGMFATTCIQPIDMIKVRIQLLGEGGAKSSANPFTVGTQIIKGEGFMSLYKGLSAGLLRQATYTTARMGIFRGLCDHFKGPDGALSLQMKAFCGLAAGGLGAFVGNPCDLALIRMQADATLPAAQRRNYTNVFNALGRIAKEEGITGWWKGSTPTVVRAMALNMGMLASYDQTKEYLTQKVGKGAVTNFASSAVAGFLASAFSLPFDFVKTRLQKQKPGPDGVLPYKNSIDCVLKVVKNEGPLAFYKGFMTYYVRIAPHAMITLLAMETLQNTFGK